MLNSMFDNKDFLTWLMIGWRLCCEAIGCQFGKSLLHYSDVIIGTMASQITRISIVYSTVCSGSVQRKHQNSASQAFVGGIHRSPVNSSHKGPVTVRKMFPFDDVIMVTWIFTREFLRNPGPRRCLGPWGLHGDPLLAVCLQMTCVVYAWYSREECFTDFVSLFISLYITHAFPITFPLQ